VTPVVLPPAHWHSLESQGYPGAPIRRRSFQQGPKARRTVRPQRCPLLLSCAVCCASCSLISGCVAKGSLQYSLCRGIENPYLGTHTYSTLRYTAHSPHHVQQLRKTSSSAPWTTPLHPDTKNLARRPALCSRARISPDDSLFVHRPPRASKQRISETALENSSENLWRKGVHMLKLDPTPSLWITDRVIRGRLYWKGR
jgi:hypothetical protein